MGETRRIGAATLQSVALAMLAVPVLVHLGMRPSQRMLDRARWGEDHDVDPRWDFRTRGVTRG